MNVRIKVYGGTPVDNLCETCAHLKQIKGHRVGDVIRNCEAIDKPISFEVATCDYYKIKPANYPKGPAVYLTFDPKRNGLLCSSGGMFPKWVTVEKWRSGYRTSDGNADVSMIESEDGDSNLLAKKKNIKLQ